MDVLSPGTPIAILSIVKREKQLTPGEPKNGRKIRIADDEESIRFTFHECLSNSGSSVAVANTMSNCIKKMQEGFFDLLFLAIFFGTENEIEAIQKLKSLQPRCKIVIIIGNPRLESLVEAKKQGAVDYLSKPGREASLLYNVKKVLSH